MTAPRTASVSFGEPVAAIATAPGPGGIAIVRLSGRGAHDLARRLLPPGRDLPEDRRSFLHGRLRHPLTGDLLDEAIVLAFPAGRSYTGEPVVEFQVHGGRLPARRVLEALGSLGVRPALPGEFTRRAFLSGRIDLTQAEAVADLIGAESERAARAAVEQLEGGLRRQIAPLYDALVALRADVEASLDFGEDEVPDTLLPEALVPRLDALFPSIDALLATGREGRLLREGARVVLAGLPNAGKSSLFNALLAADRAIVSDEPGTTRDLIEETLLLDGIPVRLVDTAGLRDASGAVERQGVLRAEAEIGRADLRLLVIDASAPAPSVSRSADSSAPSVSRAADSSAPSSAPTLLVYNKADLVPDFVPPAPPPSGAARAVAVSALTGAGLDDLRAALREMLGTADGPAASSASAAVGERHRGLLERARIALTEARAILLPPGAVPFDPVLAAQSLRDAADALGSILGRNVGEDVLDAVFSRFCIGK